MLATQFSICFLDSKAGVVRCSCLQLTASNVSYLKIVFHFPICTLSHHQYKAFNVDKCALMSVANHKVYVRVLLSYPCKLLIQHKIKDSFAGEFRTNTTSTSTTLILSINRSWLRLLYAWKTVNVVLADQFFVPSNITK